MDMPGAEHRQRGWFNRNPRFFLFLLEGIMAMMTMVIAAPGIRTNEHTDNYKWPNISERSHLWSILGRPSSPLLVSLFLANAPLTCFIFSAEPKKFLWFNINNEYDVNKERSFHLLSAPRVPSTFHELFMHLITTLWGRHCYVPF